MAGWVLELLQRPVYKGVVVGRVVVSGAGLFLLHVGWKEWLYVVYVIGSWCWVDLLGSRCGRMTSYLAACRLPAATWNMKNFNDFN